MTIHYEAVILDTETTTNKETPERPLEVVELAWFALGNLPEKGFRQLYKPTMPCTFGATTVHHILPEDLEGQPPSSHAPNDLPSAAYWIGHNIDFDWKALGSPRGAKRICTLALSRALWPECDAHTLSAMVYFTMGTNKTTRERLRNAHAALADCEFVLNLLDAITAKVNTTDLATLWELSEEARIPKTWAFGKFKDLPIAAADRGYASWCARQPDFDPYYLVALRKAGLLR